MANSTQGPPANLLKKDLDGLTEQEAARRLALRPVASEPQILEQLFGHLCNAISLVFSAAAVGLLALTGGTHHPPDWPTFLGLALLLLGNAVLGIVAERRVFQVRRALSNASDFAPSAAITARVKRDGVWSSVDAALLVRGDLIALQDGDRVPADCRVSMENSLYTDWNRTRVDDLCVFGGKVTSGNCEAVVTEAGRNGILASSEPISIDRSSSSLHTTVAQISVICLALIVVFLITEALVVYAGFHYAYHRGMNILLVILIGGIPIALPSAITLALFSGDIDLAHAGLLATRTAIVEELARVSVLVLDESALVEDTLVVGEVRAYGSFTTDEVLRMAAYVKIVETAHSTNRYLGSGGVAVEHPDIETVHYRPWSPVESAEVVYRTKGSTQLKRVAKDMLGRVFNGCTRNRRPALDDQVGADVEEFARRGMRTTGLAHEELEGDVFFPEVTGNGYEFSGLLAYHAPLRDNAQDAVMKMLELGIQVKMVTSSQLAIAKENGRRVGLGDKMFPRKVFLTDGFREYPPYPTLDALLLDGVGFAGFWHEHRQDLIQHLQHMGQVCAYVGPGIGDLSAISTVSSTVRTVSRPIGDLLTTQPCLPKLVDAILVSRRVRARLRACLVYISAASIRTILCFSLLVFIYKLDFPPFMILLVAVNVNAAALSLSIDPATSGSSKPSQWNALEVLIHAAVYGVYMALSTILFIVVAKTRFPHRAFGPALSISQAANQLNTLVYLQAVQISNFFIFAPRGGRKPFLAQRPSAILLAVFCLGQLVSSVIAAYADWEFARISPVSGGWVGFVWVWNTIWFLPPVLVSFGAAAVRKA